MHTRFNPHRQLTLTVNTILPISFPNFPCPFMPPFLISYIKWTTFLSLSHSLSLSLSLYQIWIAHHPTVWELHLSLSCISLSLAPLSLLHLSLSSPLSHLPPSPLGYFIWFERVQNHLLYFSSFYSSGFVLYSHNLYFSLSLSLFLSIIYIYIHTHTHMHCIYQLCVHCWQIQAVSNYKYCLDVSLCVHLTWLDLYWKKSILNYSMVIFVVIYITSVS